MPSRYAKLGLPVTAKALSYIMDFHGMAVGNIGGASKVLFAYEYPSNPARSFNFLYDIAIFEFPTFKMRALLFAMCLPPFFFLPFFLNLIES